MIEAGFETRIGRLIVDYGGLRVHWSLDSLARKDYLAILESTNSTFYLYDKY